MPAAKENEHDNAIWIYCFNGKLRKDLPLVWRRLIANCIGIADPKTASVICKKSDLSGQGKGIKLITAKFKECTEKQIQPFTGSVLSSSGLPIEAGSRRLTKTVGCAAPTSRYRS
jgi:hypothetical protein